MIRLDELPQELTKGRKLIEGNVIGCLWKNPLIYYDSWNLSVNDFLTEDGKVYFELGKNLYTAGFKIFDFIAVTTYLEKNEALSDWFNGKGGYRAIEDIVSSIDEENADAYYDTLIKYNILINLHNNGFDVLPHLSKFEKMPSEMVYQFYDFKLNNVFIQKQVATQIEDLIIDDKFLYECDAGEEMGISYGKHCPLLSYTTCGIHTKNLMLIAGFSGTGKAQPLTAKILTPDGYKTMGDMKVGCQVMGDDGLPHTVIGVFPQGKKKIYKVTFSDGSTTECCGEHLWNVQNPYQRQNNKFVTKELQDIMREPLYKKGKDGYKKWQVYIPMTNPLNFSTQEITIHPYVLGCIIADGTLCVDDGSILISNTEKDILNKVQNYLGNDFKLNFNNGCTYRIVKTSNNKNNKLKTQLRHLNLLGRHSNDKFIPKQYLMNDVNTRTQLLQGLFDCDGYVCGSCLEYATVSKQLAQDIKFLVHSLGGTCTVSYQAKPIYKYKGEKRIGQPCYRLVVKMPKDIIPVSSKKHLDRYKIGQTCARRTIRDIQYIGVKEAQCIYIDSDSHLYLTDDMIVTHNTSFVVANMVLPLLEQGEKVAIISNEQNINEYKRTLLASAISNELGDFSVTRKHLQIGSWTDEQKESIKAGQEYINQFEGSLKFAQCYDYDISTVKKIIRTLSKQGFKYFIYDTFKASDLSVTNSWGHMVEDSKELFQIANKEDVAIIATMQLAISLMNTRYLTAECLSTAKGVKEVCSDIVLMRPLWEDEYTGGTKDVKGYYYPKLSDGKYSKEKQEIYTMPDSKYMAIFIDKTRSGESGQQLLYKVSLRHNNWRELGFCKVREI